MRTIAALTACACALGGASNIFADTLTPTSPPVSAKTAPTVAVLSTFAVGNWSGGAYSGNGTTTFDHCAAQASYKSGIVMVFEVGSKFQWSMGFANQLWNLTVGQSYPIAFSVDNKDQSVGTAVAITANQIQVQLSANNPLFQLFRYGETLRVEAAQQNFTFALTNTVELLPALLRCAQSYVGSQGPANANPFGPPG